MSSKTHHPLSPTQSRREFAKLASLAGASALLAPIHTFAATADATKAKLPSINIFSKHLQFLGYPQMAETAAEIGFDGVDLTVRPNGHVLPQNVKTDLPTAISTIRAAGLKSELITTAVDDANDPIDRTLLNVAADHGIERYRMNWFRYAGTGNDILQQHAKFSDKVSELAELNQQLGLVGCYQNHAGTLVGASLWEVSKLIENANPDNFGIQYDIRHATVEGGLSWPTGLRLALPRIKTIVVKDFKWIEKDGRNQIVNTPIGEGTVDWLAYFKVLKENKINVPFCMHLEYDLGGAQWGQSEISVEPEVVYDAMRKDLAVVKDFWAKA